MALDTARKRAAALLIALPFRVLPAPDGNIGKEDRASLALSYELVAAAVAVVEGAGGPDALEVHLEERRKFIRRYWAGQPVHDKPAIVPERAEIPPAQLLTYTPIDFVTEVDFVSLQDSLELAKKALTEMASGIRDQQLEDNRLRILLIMAALQ